MFQKVVALFVAGVGDVVEGAGRSSAGEEQPVGNAAPGVEAGGDRLPQEPDVVGLVVFGEQDCGDLDAVAEAPAGAVKSCFLVQQEPYEIMIRWP